MSVMGFAPRAAAQRPRLEALQALRGVAAILVLSFHGTHFAAGATGVVPLGGTFLLGFSGVHIFFVLSGFLISTVHIGDIGQPGRLPRYLARRFTRIYPPYWAAVAVVLVTTDAGSKLHVAGQTVRNFLLIPVPYVWVLPVAWTLSFEILFYLCFATLILNRTAGMFLFGAWGCGILAMAVRPELIAARAGSLAWMIHPLAMLFLLGIASATLARWFGGSPLREWVGRVAPVLGITLVGVVGTAYLASGAKNWDLWWVTLGFGSAAALLMLSVLSVAIERFVASWRFLGFLGDASYSIYLLHVTVVEQLAGSFGRHARGGGAAVSGAYFLFLVLAALAAGCAFHLAVERPVRALFARAFARVSAEPRSA